MQTLSLFRANLRSAMRAHPMTAEQIARRAGYAPAYVRKVLAGRANPTLLFADCMAQAVGKRLPELLEPGA